MVERLPLPVVMEQLLLSPLRILLQLTLLIGLFLMEQMDGHVITPQGLLFNGENLATLTMLQQMFIFQEASAIQVTKST